MANSNFNIQDPILGRLDLDEIFITDAWLIDKYVGNAMYTWGKDTSTSSPTQVGAEVQWTQISAGKSDPLDASSFNIALRSDGTLWGWGDNSYGQLGMSDTNPRSTPTPVGFNLVDVYYQKNCSITEIPNILVGSNGMVSTSSERGVLSPFDINMFGKAYRFIQAPMLLGSESSNSILFDNSYFNYEGYDFEYMMRGRIRGSISPSQPRIPKILLSFSQYAYDSGAGNNYSGWKIVGEYPNRRLILRCQRNVYNLRYDSTLISFPVGRNAGQIIWEATFYEETPDQIDIQFGENIVSPDQYDPITVGATAAMRGFGGDRFGDQDIAQTVVPAISGVCDETRLVAEFPYRMQYVGYRIITSIDKVQDPTTNSWKFINCGYNNFHGIKLDNTLWASGYNTYGELGDGTTNNTSTPIKIGIDNDWSYVTSKSHSTAAIKVNNTLWTWGDNTYNQLGIGNSISQLSPTQVNNETDWVKVSTHDHCLAIKKDGTLWGWGRNHHGQLGLGDNGGKGTLGSLGATGAIVFPGATGSTGVSNPSLHLCRDDGVWSYIVVPRGGIIVNGSAATSVLYNRTIPIQVGTDINWKYIETGYHFTLAIRDNSTLWAWGLNNYGQLGDGTTIDKFSPIQIGTDSDWKYVSAHYGYSLAVKNDGTMWAWGLNSNGELGLGDTTNRLVPTLIDNRSSSSWKQVSAGTFNSAALTFSET